MQITVDTEKDSPAVLANVGKFLVLGYGSLADKTAIVAGAMPQPEAPVPPPPPAKAILAVPLDVPSGTQHVDPAAFGANEKAAQVFGATLPGTVPVPPAPTAPFSIPPAPGAIAADVERDTAGIPYDARIHNKTRTKKQNGEWKLAKGLDPAVVATVLAELIGRPLAPTPPGVPAAAMTIPSGTAVASSAGMTVPPASVLAVQCAPSIPVPLPPTGGSAAPAAAAPLSFREVMKKITDRTSGGTLTKAQVDAALGQVGFKPDELAPLVLPANAHLLAAFNELIDATGVTS